METRAENQTGLPPSDLQDLLVEFDQVLQAFGEGAASQYEAHLAELKQRVLPSANDSGIEDAGSGSTSLDSSLSTSEEDLNVNAPSGPSDSKARLGDTHALEEFIADLDRVLEEM